MMLFRPHCSLHDVSRYAPATSSGYFRARFDDKPLQRPAPVIRVIRHPGPRSNHPRGAVLAMGNFDGLHRGHAVLHRPDARARARAERRPAGVLTFEPHPRRVFIPAERAVPPDAVPRQGARDGPARRRPFVRPAFRSRLRREERRGFHLRNASSGLSAPLTSSSAGTAPSATRRRGTPEMLRAAGASTVLASPSLEPVRGEGEMVYSSTHIRELLKAGKPREAAALLGRFWEIDGRVATGDRRGRTIGFPTANLGLDDYLHPAFGVYAVRVSGRRHRTTRSPAARSTASPISACARRSAPSHRGWKRICSTPMWTSTGDTCGSRWSISSVPSRNSPASTRSKRRSPRMPPGRAPSSPTGHFR